MAVYIIYLLGVYNTYCNLMMTAVYAWACILTAYCMSMFTNHLLSSFFLLSYIVRDAMIKNVIQCAFFFTSTTKVKILMTDKFIGRTKNRDEDKQTDTQTNTIES